MEPYFCYKEQVDFMESDQSEIFERRDNKILKSLSKFDVPNILMNKLFELINRITQTELHTIHFNTLSNPHCFVLDSNLNG